MKKIPHVSLLIPCYNEEHRLSKNLNKIVKFLSKKPYAWELIIIDDGSKDKTSDIVSRQAAVESSIRLIKLKKNQGKGAAIKRGVMNATSNYIVFTDVDLSVSIETLDVMLTLLQSSAVVIGVRRRKGSSIKKHQPLYREFMGHIFTKYANIVLNVWVSDFTCGFKGFESSVAKQLFHTQRVPGWSFDAEVLYLAKRNGYAVCEHPVEWTNEKNTKVNILRDAVLSFIDILRIRYYSFFGYYESVEKISRKNYMTDRKSTT